MSQNALIHNTIKQLHIFDDLPDVAMQDLFAIAKLKTYDTHEFIIKEKEKGEHIYLIASGSAEVIKTAPEDQTTHRLATLTPHSWFGEIALFNQEERIASVRALEPTTLISFSFSALKALPHSQALIRTILAHTATQRGAHLKGANQQILDAVQHELKLTKLHEEVGRFIIYTFILITVFVYTMKLLGSYTIPSALKYFVNSLLILLIGVWALFTVKSSSYPLEFYGLSLKNWYKNAKEAVLITLPFLALLTLIKWGLIHHVERFKDLQLFGPKHKLSFLQELFTPSPDFSLYWLWLIAYTLLVPVQELIIRGCVQGCLTHFFRSPHRALLAIVVSNLLFMTFHNLGGIGFSLFAGFFGLMWGWLYNKQKTLVGPIISHGIGGFYILGILNYGVILA